MGTQPLLGITAETTTTVCDGDSVARVFSRQTSRISSPSGESSRQTRDNATVRSHKAGQRVMALLKRLYEKLHLSVNESKSAVASAFGRKFLGYAFWASPQGLKRTVAVKARKQFKHRIRELTRRSGGRSLRQVVENLRPYLLGWKTYFGLSQTPRIWRELDEWMRHRLRAIQLKQWRRGPTIYRELRALGASSQTARKVAANSYSWWRNSRFELNRVLDVAWFDRLGLVRLS